MARGRWVVIPLFLALLVGAVMLAGRIGDVTTDEPPRARSRSTSPTSSASSA
jgi:hypothetical protein